LSSHLRQTELSCRCVKLVGKRHAFALQYELAFANHMHQFDAGQDRAVILLDNVVEIFDLPNRDRNFAFLVQLLQRCLWLAPLLSIVTLSNSCT
jgi:hypothetical protein